MNVPPFLFLLVLSFLFEGHLVFGQTWPCLQTSPTTGFCDAANTIACTPSSTPGKLVCPPPACTVDADCQPFKCKPGAAPRVCEDFQEKNAGELCGTHIECGPDKLCGNSGRCTDVDASSPLFGSTFSKCIVSGPGSGTCDPTLEKCQPNPTAVTTEGVCIKITSNPQALKDALAGIKPTPSGGTTVAPAPGARPKEGEACTVGVTTCAVPFYCADGGTCQKTITLTNNVTGHRIPPPPGTTNCRDALDSGEADETKSKCKDREEMCTEPLYIELMREQCPKTCGYCDDPTLDLSDYAEEEAAPTIGRGGGAVKTVKVNPSASCSDRKLPGKESDCPNLKSLCTDPIYKKLMEEECPKTCGFCK